MTALAWIGARARWVLVIGAGLGLALPDLSAFLRPALPALIAMVYTLAMLRIDTVAVARNLAHPAQAARAAATVALMLVAAPAAACGMVAALGLGAGFEAAAVYAFAAPPIASAASFALMTGLNAALTLELTVLCSLAMPIVGPLVAAALLGAELDIQPLDLGLRMAAMIFSGAAAALILRRLIGVGRIHRNAKALDGIAALAFLLFILPLFDGIGPAIAASPGLAAALFAFACLCQFGPPLIAHWLRPRDDDAGALGLVFGSRSVAIYFAALPPDPVFALFVALYQFPMAALALLYNWLRR